ncbi:phosphotransferase enzyme family protein [Dactylonectria macrodidyma]|uniref:Phosphotransferase enzyme family protein n=1 Tax=Dactylonectria macrodidyma TaxID=307937 RepID=A0A9P9FTK2_9HYPO|nr:phosphotransferase enzyme family protein [Dactylonectria macrodidyma]
MPTQHVAGCATPTEDQYNQSKKAFIAPLDWDAKNGSFNICSSIEFDQGGQKWIVRVPIEPAADNLWDKLFSEVTTLQYLEHNTRIPIPHILLIADLIPGKPLDKKLLIEAEMEHGRNFYSSLLDILVELRKLEFPAVASLMPNPNGSSQPIVGPIISMSVASLRLLPHPVFTSAKIYLEYWFGIISEFFSPPGSDYTAEDIKEEVFALHEMGRVFGKAIDSRLDEYPFFSGNVPRQVFTPPSWITGHGSIETNKQIHAEFRDGLEWYDELGAECSNFDQTNMAFCVTHVLRRPTDMTQVFYDFFAPKISDEPADERISKFFKEIESPELDIQPRTE